MLIVCFDSLLQNEPRTKAANKKLYIFCLIRNKGG